MDLRLKYARVERERRFLVKQFPPKAEVVRSRHLADRYVDGTTLRLREQRDEDGIIAYKLTQKLPAPDGGAQQGFITTMYITKEEFCVLAQLPARLLNKTRYSVPPFGIDVFEGELKGLILAEAEFDSASDADGLIIPCFISREVSSDDRFTGGQLARATIQDVKRWLLDYRINDW